MSIAHFVEVLRMTHDEISKAGGVVEEWKEEVRYAPRSIHITAYHHLSYLEEGSEVMEAIRALAKYAKEQVDLRRRKKGSVPLTDWGTAVRSGHRAQGRAPQAPGNSDSLVVSKVYTRLGICNTMRKSRRSEKAARRGHGPKGNCERVQLHVR